MDAADRVYGVSMGGDGISRVISRRLGETIDDEPVPAQAELADGGSQAVA
jgi:hypothetical protein